MSERTLCRDPALPDTEKVPGPHREQSNESAGARRGAGHRERRGPTRWAPHREHRSPTQRALGPDTESAGARHREWRESARSAGARQTAREQWGTCRGRESGGARHRECGSPTRAGHRERRGATQRALGPQSTGARHRERWGPTQRAPGPDTENGGRAPGFHTD